MLRCKLGVGFFSVGYMIIRSDIYMTQSVIVSLIKINIKLSDNTAGWQERSDNFLPLLGCLTWLTASARLTQCPLLVSHFIGALVRTTPAWLARCVHGCCYHSFCWGVAPPDDRPLLSRKASCSGARPRKFFSISSASWNQIGSSQ